jgi:hypothetical protein
MTPLLLIPVAWIVLLALAVGLCMAASRGEETRDFLEIAPSSVGRDAAHGASYYTYGAEAIDARQADEARAAHPTYVPAAARRAAADIIAA